jgi:hypothetical protein
MKRALFDLEVWLIGTPAELDAAIALLRQLGQVKTLGRPTRLVGADAGRSRLYLRITVPIRPAPARAA